MDFPQRRARHELDAMFLIARQNPKISYNMPGRGMGKHCTARFERSRAKSHKRRHPNKPYTGHHAVQP
jgi:hypothetical protein